LPLRFPFTVGEISFFVASIALSIKLGPFCVSDSTIPEGEDDGCGGIFVLSEFIDGEGGNDIIPLLLLVYIYYYYINNLIDLIKLI
jgi:hypothetical protein